MRATPAGAEIAKLEEAVNLREQVSMRAWARTADLTKQYGVDLNEVRREPSAMRSREPG